MKALNITAIAVLSLLVVMFFSLFIVKETEQVLVIRFGVIEKTVSEPGLNFKLPFIDRVYRYDKRLLSLDSDEFSVTFSDNRRLNVDAFSRWRIQDVEAYHLAVRRFGEDGARSNLASILEDGLKGVLGKVDTGAILSENRTLLMKDILNSTQAKANRIGVEVVDVRIVRTDLPPDNLDATYNRMSAEREQEAEDQIARGEEAATKIRAGAQRESDQITSDARRQSEVIKGETDAEVNGIFADAYTRDAEFFDFYRSLQAYRDSLQSGNTSILLSPDSDFFRYLNSQTGGDVPNFAPSEAQ